MELAGLTDVVAVDAVVAGRERTHDVTLAFEDGVEHTIPVGENETVLAAALARGIQLVHQCTSGSCGTCSARVVEGAIVMDSSRACSLLPSEIEAGHRLTCSSSVTCDTRLLMPYPSDLAFGPAPRRSAATVTASEWLNEAVVRLDLRLDAGSELRFASGQYVRIQVPGTDEWRSYSIFTTPEALPELGFLIKVLPGGAMSGYLHDAMVGDALVLEGALGSFGLRKSTRSHVLIAGGTGLAPILSMLDMLRIAPGRTPPITLCFACSREQDLFFEDELDLRALWMPTLRARVGVSRPAPGYLGLVGDPVTLLDGCDLGTSDVDAYICGPPGMVGAARQRLLGAGVPESQIRSERFLPSANG